MNILGYDHWGPSRSFMTSRMTLSTMCLVQNPQNPPSIPFKEYPFLTHF